MGTWETLLVAFSLGMDAFSVALGVGSRGATARQTFRLSFHFGLFQFLMPLIGWQVGRGAAGLVAAYDHWIAFGILTAVGLHMIVESFTHEMEKAVSRDLTRGWSLVGLSVATSIDALAVGVGFGVLGQRLLGSAVVIGLTAGLMTLVGIQAARTLRLWVGRRLETVGGLLLIGLAVKMLMM
ncbi:MAG: manganese efflux pump MntP family protein [Candidatus Sumerlaeia bacterium]|nr:manganese efflux pump MntP family protein [Candidatus Sumerlaeia bacterium]